MNPREQKANAIRRQQQEQMKVDAILKHQVNLAVELIDSHAVLLEPEQINRLMGILQAAAISWD